MNKKLLLTKVDKQCLELTKENNNFFNSPRSPWQGQTTNFLSSPRTNNKYLELTRNPKLDSWAKQSTASSTLQRSGPVFNICKVISPSLFFSSLDHMFISVGNQREKMRKVLQRWFIPNSYSKFNFCLTPDLDVNQLGGDVGGSQLPHVEEGSGHVPAHHLHLPLPSLSGQAFSLFSRIEPSKLVSRFLPEFSAFWCSTSLKETSSQL